MPRYEQYADTPSVLGKSLDACWQQGATNAAAIRDIQGQVTTAQGALGAISYPLRSASLNTAGTTDQHAYILPDSVATRITRLGMFTTSSITQQASAPDQSLLTVKAIHRPEGTSRDLFNVALNDVGWTGYREIDLTPTGYEIEIDEYLSSTLVVPSGKTQSAAVVQVAIWLTRMS